MEQNLRIPASRHAFDLWRLGESGGILKFSETTIYFYFHTVQQYETYLLLGNNK